MAKERSGVLLVSSQLKWFDEPASGGFEMPTMAMPSPPSPLAEAKWMIRLKLTWSENAQCSRKYLSAKDLDSKYLRANQLRVSMCAG
jgi:hypothetical protein